MSLLIMAFQHLKTGKELVSLPGCQQDWLVVSLLKFQMCNRFALTILVWRFGAGERRCFGLSDLRPQDQYGD